MPLTNGAGISPENQASGEAGERNVEKMQL
jgi:hypothetical protein